jgi:hypothetical protein
MGGRNPPSGGAPGDDGRRRYPHVERSQDPVKRSHNDWVVASALEHGTDVLVLDGLDLNTTSLLIRAGVPYDAIHVPNRPDFDALMKRERATFGGGAAGAAPEVAVGHVYRATAQEFVDAYASLTKPARPVKTVWLDLNARWGLAVERTVRQLFACRMLGTGDADLFLTLSRGFHAQQLDAVADLVGELFFETYGRRGTLELVDDHTGNYGTGMMILHWRVRAPAPLWDLLFAPADGAALADRLAREAKAFRKPQNMRRATRGDRGVNVVCLAGGGGRGDADDDYLAAVTACACADLTDVADDAPAAAVPLTTMDGVVLEGGLAPPEAGVPAARASAFDD